MRSVYGISRKLMRKTRRRARVVVRSLLLHLLVLALLGVGLFVRMTESSDLQVAGTRRASLAAALAVADGRATALSPRAAAAPLAAPPAAPPAQPPSRASARD